MSIICTAAQCAVIPSGFTTAPSYTVWYQKQSTNCCNLMNFAPSPQQRYELRSIAISLSVFLHISKTTFPNFRYLKPVMAIARSSSASILYVLPVFWMTSRLHANAGYRRRETVWCWCSKWLIRSMQPQTRPILSESSKVASGEGQIWYLRLPFFGSYRLLKRATVAYTVQQTV